MTEVEVVAWVDFVFFGGRRFPPPQKTDKSMGGYIPPPPGEHLGLFWREKKSKKT
jgi:hypothetical protein